MSTASDRIRVLVAEDNVDLAAAVRAILDAEPDLAPIGTVARADELIDGVRNGDAQVVILDLNLDGGSSVPALHELRRTLPRVAVVIFTGHDRGDVRAALGAMHDVEIVAKTGDTEALLAAVRRAARR